MATTDHLATRPLAPYVPVILRELIAGGRTSLTEVDGSILFADVSGFTALSERLAKHGREGTEALITLIDRIMDRLAGAAQQLGGDIIGFGGDALIVAFRDEGHELRAAAAAFDLQRALWPFRSAATGFGRATLSSSVGVASGPLLFAAPGTPHRGLIVAGPTSTLVCACEGEASAGQILVAPSTARALEPRVVGARQEHGHPLLERPSCEATWPPDTGDLAAAERIAAMGLPGGLARHLAQSGESEHRQFVAGFVVVRGTRRAARARPRRRGSGGGSHRRSRPRDLRRARRHRRVAGLRGRRVQGLSRDGRAARGRRRCGRAAQRAADDRRGRRPALASRAAPPPAAGSWSTYR